MTNLNPNLPSATTPAGANHWLAELSHALQAGDDPGLWRLMSEHEDQAEAHHRLATQVARLAYRMGDRPRFCELFLVPVIETGHGSVLGNQNLWRQADICMGEALDGWLPPKTYKTVFTGVRPYDWIGTWRPGVLRSHLTSTVPGVRHDKLTFVTEDVVCPSDAPRLGFICMALTSERGWPQLSEVNTLRDNRFKTVVSHALTDTKEAVAPMVLTPDRVQFAVTDGLCLWLHLLNEAVPILGWMAQPVASTPDVVKITMKLDSEQVPMTQFTIRKHQIGLQGLDAVLVMLTTLAPTIDTPMDLPRPVTKVNALDLT